MVHCVQINMEKYKLTRGSLTYKNGKTEFVEDRMGKFWIDQATGKIRRGRPWILRKLHSGIWNWKDVICGFPLISMVVTFLVPIALEVNRPDVSWHSCWIQMGCANIGLLLIHGLGRLIKEPSDKCDC